MDDVYQDYERSDDDNQYDDDPYEEEEKDDLRGEAKTSQVFLSKIIINYKQLITVSVPEIKIEIQNLCKDLMETLEISYDEALILLNHYYWRKNLVEEKWFEDYLVAKKDAGLRIPEYDDIKPEKICVLCHLVDNSEDKYEVFPCGHMVCKECLAKFIELQVKA